MNHYEILEVSPKASREVIRAAYKSLMQRYHPDKHPADAEVAKHASRLAQSYEVLYDADRRATYDLKLKERRDAASPPVPAAQGKGVQPKTAACAPPRNSAGNPSRWYPWALILVILLSGWLILNLSKKKPPPALQELPLPAEMAPHGPRQAATASQAADESAKAPAEVDGKRSEKKELDFPARTVSLFPTTLTVTLKAADKFQFEEKPSQSRTEHVLSIPVMLVKVGSFDTDRFIRYLDTRKDPLSLQLSEKLASTRYEELVRVDGDQYLKKIILDALGEITGASRFQEFPSTSVESPGRYGVTEVLLPESFLLK